MKNEKEVTVSDEDVFNSDISMVMILAPSDVCEELVGDEFTEDLIWSPKEVTRSQL